MNPGQIVENHVVYVARQDLHPDSRSKPRETTGQIRAFPSLTEREQARTVLRDLFENVDVDTSAILLFQSQRDATVRANRWTDNRVLEVNLVGNLYRELRQYVQEVEYTGALPRIDGRAFLVFSRLAHGGETKAEKDAAAAKKAKEVKEAKDAKDAKEDKPRGRKDEKGPSDGKKAGRSGSRTKRVTIRG